MVRSNYLYHESIYGKFAQEGRMMWGDEEQLSADINRLTELLSLKKSPPGCRALDLGCGTGEIVSWLEGNGYDSVGIDISKTAINIARERYSSLAARFYSLDISVTDTLILAPFDVVVDNWFLHCIIGSDRDKVLNCISRSMSRDGVLLGSCMCNKVHGKTFEKSFDVKTRNLMDGDVAMRHIGTEKTLLAEFEAAGFSLIYSVVKSLQPGEPGADEFHYVLMNGAG